MPRLSRFSLLFGLLVLSASRAWCLRDPATPEAARVIVLANASDLESLKVASHYCEKRAIPEDNIIALPMSSEETIRWDQFVREIWEPLRAELRRRDFLAAKPQGMRDAMGREVWEVAGHVVSYLVICRGVPLRILNEGNVKETPTLQQVLNERMLQVTAASVDGELSVLPVSHPIAVGFMENPLFLKDHPRQQDRQTVLRVARLDGPTQADALGLVDSALAGEARGLIGRAYVDLGGLYPAGDVWLKSVRDLLVQRGYDLDVEETSSVFSDTARMDGAVLYFGWYAPHVCGPFARAGFRFEPGAIAFHLHSFSAETLRSSTRGWCGPLVAHGAAVTFGNVWEPYLFLTHHPQVFLGALLQGATVGEAAYRALPALSWQGVVIGDPLYRPFRHDFGDWWQARANLDARHYGYLVLMRLHQLELIGLPEEAVRVGERELGERPSLALAIGVGRLLSSSADNKRLWSCLRQGLEEPGLNEGSLAEMDAAMNLLIRQGLEREAGALVLEYLRRAKLGNEVKRHWLDSKRGILEKSGVESLIETP